MSYDAWGRLRDPETHEVYGSDQQPVLFLGRGYTCHEHLTQFGLINMNHRSLSRSGESNARLYDPVLGRFLYPAPNVQEPYMPQIFNRFSYAMNNPLCYVDENGESFFDILCAIVGA